MPEIAENYIHLAQYKIRPWLKFFFSRSFMIIWGCCCCIKVNICWKFCICSCYCLVCGRMTCIKSWCCFLDCSSFLLSASSRRFCSCISSIFRLCMRSFFSRKYATVSLAPPRRFALPAVSFSTSSFLCLFCVLPRFSRALYIISAALALSSFFLSFCYLLKCFFNVTQICIYSAQKSISFSYRSLRHSELGMLKAVRIVRYFIPNLAPYDASSLCLERFKNGNLLSKTTVMFSPLHVGSKDKNSDLGTGILKIRCC